VVLISTLGGLAIFGLNGFVIGPLIAALFIAAWSLYAESRHENYPPLIIDDALHPGSPASAELEPEAQSRPPAGDLP
jgi:hypothetical protein